MGAESEVIEIAQLPGLFARTVSHHPDIRAVLEIILPEIQSGVGEGGVGKPFAGPEHPPIEAGGVCAVILSAVDGHVIFLSGFAVGVGVVIAKDPQQG